MGARDFAGTFLVEVQGRPLPADVAVTLSLAYVDDYLHLPDAFLLRFRDPDRVVLPKSGITVGSMLKLSVETAGESAPEVLVNGEVTAVEVELDGEGTFTVVRGYDQAHRLFRGTRVSVFANMSYADVARKVARRAGLKAGTIKATGAVHPHIGQGGVDDWTFLQRLGREVGFQITVEDGKLSFAPPPPAAGAPAPRGGADAGPYVIQPGDDLLSLRSAVTAAEQVPRVEVRSWNHQTKRAVVGTAPATTTTVQVGVTPASLAGKFGAPPYLSTREPYRVQGAADWAAKAIAEQVAGSFAELEGVVRGNARLRAGTAVTVAGLGEPFDGKYSLSRVRHVFEPEEGYTTSISVTGQQERSLLGLANGAGARPEVSGVAVGVVTDTKDPQSAGRVKVKLPWLGDDFVTDWATVVQAGAGRQRGWLVLPEVGDEVLVAFEQGELARPYVVGGLFNDVDTPPASPPPVDSGTGKVVRRAFVSRTGHKLEFLETDSKADQGVSVVTGDGKLQLVMDTKTTKVSVTSDGTVVVDGAKGIQITSSQGDVEVSGRKITLTAKSGVAVNGGAGNVDVKSNAQLALTGLTASLQGQTKTEVKGGAMCEIAAALVKIN